MKKTYWILSSIVVIAALSALFFLQRESGSVGQTVQVEQPTDKNANVESATSSSSSPPVNASNDPLGRGRRENLRDLRKHHRFANKRPLSSEEIKKNRDAALKLQEQQAQQARKDVQSDDESVRLHALSYLDPNNEEDVRRIENVLLTDPNPEVREEAAFQISDADRKIAEPALIRALSDPSSDVAISAIEALSTLPGAPKAARLEAIKHIGRSHPSEDVRETAQEVLEEMER